MLCVSNTGEDGVISVIKKNPQTNKKIYILRIKKTTTNKQDDEEKKDKMHKKKVRILRVEKEL